MFLSLVLLDYRIPVCVQLLVMIVIAGKLALLHQEKRILNLIRRRCVLTQGPNILRLMRPVRPDLRRKVPYVLTQRRNVPYVLTQRRNFPYILTELRNVPYLLRQRWVLLTARRNVVFIRRPDYPRFSLLSPLSPDRASSASLLLCVLTYSTPHPRSSLLNLN